MKKNLLNKWLLITSIVCFSLAGIMFLYLKMKNGDFAKLQSPNFNVSNMLGEKKNCNNYTPDVGVGQYYYSNLPKLMTNELNYKSSFGKQLKVSGYVYASLDDSQPLAKAKIELWQPDEIGVYRPNSSGDYEKIEKDDFEFRGYIETDEKGYYEYTTLIPGEKDAIPRHSSFRVSKEGYSTVSTQLIYTLPEDKAMIDKYETTKLLLDCQIFNNLSPKDGIYTVKYDFRLKK